MSSARIRSTLSSVSTARKVISFRFPIGVEVMNKDIRVGMFYG